MFIGHSLLMLQRIIGMPKKFLVIHQNRTNELSSRVDKPATGLWYIEIHRVERNFIDFYRVYVFELARFVKIWVPDVASSRKLRNEWNLLESRQLCPPSIWAMIAPSPTRCRQEMDERYVLPWLCRWSCLVISHGSLFSKIRVPLSVLVHSCTRTDIVTWPLTQPWNLRNSELIQNNSKFQIFDTLSTVHCTHFISTYISAKCYLNGKSFWSIALLRQPSEGQVCRWNCQIDDVWRACHSNFEEGHVTWGYCWWPSSGGVW